MGWISCSERLPEMLEVIIISAYGKSYAGYYAGGDFYAFVNFDKGGLWCPQVTHWMPLPENEELGIRNEE
jgi:hypothetical protein